MDVNTMVLVMCWVITAAILIYMLPMVIEWFQDHAENKRVTRYREKMFSNFPVHGNVLTLEQNKYLREQLEWCRRAEHPYSPFDIPETLVGASYDNIHELLEKEHLTDDDVFLLNNFVGVSIKFFDRLVVWGPSGIVESLEGAMEDRDVLNKHIIESIDDLLTRTSFTYGGAKAHLSWTADEKYSVWLKTTSGQAFIQVRDRAARTWAHYVLRLDRDGTSNTQLIGNTELIEDAVQYLKLVHSLGIIDTPGETEKGRE